MEFLKRPLTFSKLRSMSVSHWRLLFIVFKEPIKKRTAFRQSLTALITQTIPLLFGGGFSN